MLRAKARVTLIPPLAVLAVLTCRDKPSAAVPDRAPAPGAPVAPISQNAPPPDASLTRFDAIISHCDHSDLACLEVSEDSQLILSAGRAYRDSSGLHLRLRTPACGAGCTATGLGAGCARTGVSRNSEGLSLIRE